MSKSFSVSSRNRTAPSSNRSPGQTAPALPSDTGADVSLNISGPGRNILYPHGDVEIVSIGRYANALGPEQAAQLGTPQIFASSGLIDYVTHPDGSMTPITIPHNVTNICALLGAE